MPLVPHSITRRTTNFNTSSTTPVVVNTIADTEFVAGRKYLLLIQAQWAGADPADNYELETRHGTTVFPGSTHQREPTGITPNRLPYSYMTVWTAVASEDIELRITSLDGTQMELDTATMIAIEISEELTENTDWHFNEVIATTSLTAEPTYTSTNNAGVTFTPPNAGDTWLIICHGQINAGATTEELYSRLQRTGEATENDTEVNEESEDPADLIAQSYAKVLTLGAVSNTFEQASASETGGVGDREYSAVFAINLSKFVTFASQFTQAGITLDTTNAFATSTEVATATNTPATAQSDSLIFGSFVKSVNEDSGATGLKARLQFDNADAPANQTSQDFEQNDGWDVRDQLFWRLVDIIANPSVAAHDVDVDSTNTTTMTVGDRLAFIVELAILNTIDDTFDVDATLFVPQLENFDVDAILFKTDSDEPDVDALLLGTTPEDFNVDALLALGPTLFPFVDAFLSVILDNDFDVDARLEGTVVIDVDALLQDWSYTVVDAILRGQLSVPIAPDISVDGWLPTPLWPEIDEEPAGGDFISLTGAAFNGSNAFNVTMSPVLDPVYNTGNAGKDHKMRVNARSLMGNIALKMRLAQNVTVVAESPFFRVPAGVFTMLEYTLTQAEADAITDYSALRITVIPGVIGDPENTFGVDAVLI
jgi:hypothetical protein